MDKKFIILLLGLIAIVTLAVFTDAEGLAYKENTIIDFKIPCSNNNSICSNSATCNITFIYSNSSVFVDNGIMTNSGTGIFNYTLSEAQTNLRGYHQAVIFCIDNGYTGSNIIDFVISKSGDELDTGKTIIISTLIIGLIVFGIVFMFLAIKINDSLAILKIIFVILSFFSIISSLYLGNLFLQEYFFISSFKDVYGTLFSIFMYSTIIFSLIAIIYFISHIVKAKKEKKEEE